VKAGKVVLAERKKWQAEGKALAVDTQTIATQTNQIEKPKAIRVHDSTQTEVPLEELEKKGEGEHQGQ